MEFYKVGGYVRDKLLGIPSKDIDYTVVLDDLSLSAEEGFSQLSSYLKENGYEIFLETPECFTIRAKLGREVADFVLARNELGYDKESRRPIVELGDLYDDLERRDFTVNALAEDNEGKVIDYFNGLEHLKERRLMTPIDPIKSLLDDPLRVLRAFRFAITKCFIIDIRVKRAMESKELATKFIKVVSTERIREELDKMFRYDTPETLAILEELYDCNAIIYNHIWDNIWLKPTTEKK